MANQSQLLHFVLFPHMAQGHMIPMVDIARMLAQHGVIVTIITTPINAKRYASSLARAVDSGLPIRLVEIRFPNEKVGLPEDCENLDMMPRLNMFQDFFDAAQMLHEQVEPLFEGLMPRPSCIISDVCLPYTADIATKFGVPRISFYGTSTFYMVCMNNLYTGNVLKSITSDEECFNVPGLPDHIELTKKQLPEAALDLTDVGEKMISAELCSHGIIINSFEELETSYVQRYKEAKGDNTWCVGPVSLSTDQACERILSLHKYIYVSV